MKTIFSKHRQHIFSLVIMLIIIISCLNTDAQCSSPTLKFHSPELISGTAGEVGAIYLFREVIPEVDAHIEIAGIYGGATLYNIDDSAGIGYYDAFQPYIGAAANDTSYIDWKITFKVGGSYTDTLLPCLAVTGVDVDGDGSHLQEFIEAATPGSIAVDPATILNVSFDGVRSKAISTIYNLPLIDSAHHEAMFQMNFVNISTLLYRNGAVSTYGAEEIRQTCIYFKPFFDQTTFIVLPAKILSFTAKSVEGYATLSWSATNENQLAGYTIEKSIDGKKWTSTQQIKPGSLTTINNYLVTDHDKNTSGIFYRLKQTNTYGVNSYSKTVYINTTREKLTTVTHNTMVSNKMNLQISASGTDRYVATYFTATGANIREESFPIQAGVNSHTVNFSPTLAPGIYLFMIRDQKGQKIYSSRMVKS